MLKKVLKPEGKIQLKDLQNTTKEFEVLCLINHPCICKTFGMNTQEKFGNLKTIALFLEYLDFELKKCLDKNILTNSMKVKIAVEIASGMSYIHKLGMIHRDLNINNIMMNRFFESKIINFGQVHIQIATQNESSISLTKNIGNFDFMSPEMQKDDYDNKTDVYSYGVILFKLFSGNMPNISIKDKMNEVLLVFPRPSPMMSKCCI